MQDSLEARCYQRPAFLRVGEIRDGAVLANQAKAEGQGIRGGGTVGTPAGTLTSDVITNTNVTTTATSAASQRVITVPAIVAANVLISGTITSSSAGTIPAGSTVTAATGTTITISVNLASQMPIGATITYQTVTPFAGTLPSSLTVNSIRNSIGLTAAPPALTLSAPLTVDSGFGPNWAAAK